MKLSKMQQKSHPKRKAHHASLFFLFFFFFFFTDIDEHISLVKSWLWDTDIIGLLTCTNDDY